MTLPETAAEAATPEDAGEPRRRARIGSVPYLNAAPLVHGIEGEVERIPPSLLARRLRRGELDTGLVSISEVLEHDLYDVLEGAAVGSDGPVFSVFLSHRIPLSAVTEVFCDPASLTSVRLLQVLLAERGLRPALPRLGSYAEAGGKDAVLLIGDPAIAFRRSAAAEGRMLWDLGQAWKKSTGLPFVYAVWALRRGVENTSLRRTLIQAKERGTAALGDLVRDRPEFDEPLRDAYLRRHIRYGFGAAEQRGVAAFVERLTRLGIASARAPRYVQA